MTGGKSEKLQAASAVNAPGPPGLARTPFRGYIIAAAGRSVYHGNDRSSKAGESEMNRSCCVLVLMTCLAAWAPLQAAAPAAKEAKLPALKLPSSRAFYLGFTPMPYAMTMDAINNTYAVIAEHGGVIAHDLDKGVPWPEALAKTDYHEKVEGDLKGKLDLNTKDLNVFLSCSPMSSNHDSLAKYWSAKEKMELPAKWRLRTFDHPEVIRAYLNYCRDLIDRFRPAYMAYATDANELAEKNPKAYMDFARLARVVYRTLKKENPKLPLMMTFSLGSPRRDGNSKRLRRIKELMTFSDVLAVTVQPILMDQKFADPRRLPADWLSQVMKIKGVKPFAVAKTWMPAEPLSVTQPPIKLRCPATEMSQAGYVHRLCKEAQRMGAMFVIWQVPIDYDELWEAFKAKGLPEFFKVWRDTGLYDGKRRPRASLKVWDAWRALPVKPRARIPVWRGR